MRVKVAYCGYVRKDGSINQVAFDTEKKVYTNNDIKQGFTFIEAKISRDVDWLRYALRADCYEERKEI